MAPSTIAIDPKAHKTIIREPRVVVSSVLAVCLAACYITGQYAAWRSTAIEWVKPPAAAVGPNMGNSSSRRSLAHLADVNTEQTAVQPLSVKHEQWHAEGLYHTGEDYGLQYYSFIGARHCTNCQNGTCSGCASDRYDPDYCSFADRHWGRLELYSKCFTDGRSVSVRGFVAFREAYPVGTAAYPGTLQLIADW